MPQLLRWKPTFSGKDPYDGILWAPRDVKVTKADGTIIFQQKAVDAPTTWSQQAVAIVAQKYLRGYVGLDGNPGINRETSIKQLIERVANTIAGWAGFKLSEGEQIPEGWDGIEVWRYADTKGIHLHPMGETYRFDCKPGEEGTRESCVVHRRPKQTMQPRYEVYFETHGDWLAWKNDLKRLLVTQKFAFNSPVWFNVGVDEHPQCSACFIVRMEDFLQNENDKPFDINAHGLLAAQVKEGIIFSNGSGSGINLSRIRSSKEFLSGGGHATGPLSFARGLDTWASQIKSGGKSRRAAKMLIMDMDHPDIHEFIRAKAEEEKIAKILKDKGYGGDMDSESYQHAFHQNSNLSGRASDAFMRAVDERHEWSTIARSKHHLKGTAIGKRMIGGTGLVIESLKAYDLMKEAAQACWECGDPGLQFGDTINAWHTCADDDAIYASNPCSEYLFLDETACNLGSLNLVKFMVDGKFNEHEAHAALVTVTVAMEVIVPNSKYPTENFAKMSDAYRTLGVGFSNLGGLLMKMGLPYDSNEGHAVAGAISSLMTASVYSTSAEIAKAIGPFSRFKANRESCTKVMKKHLEADQDLVQLNPVFRTLQFERSLARGLWKQVVEACEHGAGIRNAQASVVAPTGTISIFMDCDTMGIEPELAHVKFKALAGGGTLKMVNTLVEEVLQTARFTAEEIKGVLVHMLEGKSFRTFQFNGKYEAATLNAVSEILKTSFPPNDDPEYAIPWNAHIEMMAAVQPFISGGISKTVNMPNSATVEDIMGAFNLAWHRGLKCVAIYRDGCKAVQPLSTKQQDDGSLGKMVGGMIPGVVAGAKTQEEQHQAGKNLAALLERAGLRRKPPSHVPTLRCKFEIDGYSGYLHVGFFADNWDVAEIFVKMSKMGSSIAGFVDGFCRLYSVAIQYGVPLQELIDGFRHVDFEPHGFVQDDPHVRSCRSIPDYIVQKVEALQKEAHAIKALPLEVTSIPSYPGPVAATDRIETAKTGQRSGKSCNRCGSMDVRMLGKCNICMSCGNEEGGCYA